MTPADKLWSVAHDAGVEVCFANPGTTEMWLVDGLNRSSVRAILGLHETVCSGAADGYGRLSRKPASVLLHLGPGLANALSNFHNARRASTPVLNLVGAMASWHEAADPLLNMNVVALAESVSKRVVVTSSADSISDDVRRACTATQSSDQAGGSRISTVIIPHDHTWPQERNPLTALNTHHMASKAVASTPSQLRPPALQPAVQDFIASCVKAMTACPKGQSAIYAGGQALLQDDGCIACLGNIAAATGAALLCENAFSRIDRGTGLPHFQRLAYFPQEAAKELSKYSLLVTVDARLPVAMFGYKDGPSQLVTLADDNVWQLDSSCVNIPLALQQLMQQAGASNIVPGRSCGGLFSQPARPELPKGKLTARSMCAVIAHMQPQDAIIVDESLTSGGAYWDLSKGCPPFSHLTLTGGAIGSGPPMAVGAAVACPHRCVINIQADGSAMYSLQALWTQVREELHVVTIICANRSYSILKLEIARQKIPKSGQGMGSQDLTDIGHPIIDWTELATGMGVQHAVKAHTSEDLQDALQQALGHKGPSLIECVL